MFTNSDSGTNSREAWFMLPARFVLFLIFQGLFALIYWLTGNTRAWDSSSAWWPITVTLANVICIVLLIKLFKRESLSYKGLFRFERQYIKKDILVLLGFLVISGPIGYLPNILIARGLFGNEVVASELLFRHLPLWAAWLSLFFLPITQGLAELPTYFGYVMPRLKTTTNSAILAVVLPSLFLAIQHIGAPLLLDSRFIVYRMTMFLPFAFLVGILLYWRPRLLPYMAIIHILMNISTAILLLNA